MGVDSAFPSIVFHVFGVPVRDTVITTWALMGLVIGISWFGTRRLKNRPGAVQNVLEAAVEVLARQVDAMSPHGARFLPFAGTLAIFLVLANSAATVPGVLAPTADPSTAVALALVAFASVHVYGFTIAGRRYLHTYVEPSWLLLPFNIIGEVTRTVALAVRLFGNMLSGQVIVAILVLLAGFLVPVPMQLFGLLIGLIQAYVFTLLTLVYITAGLQGMESGSGPPERP